MIESTDEGYWHCIINHVGRVCHENGGKETIDVGGVKNQDAPSGGAIAGDASGPAHVLAAFARNSFTQFRSVTRPDDDMSTEFPNWINRREKRGGQV